MATAGDRPYDRGDGRHRRCPRATEPRPVPGVDIGWSTRVGAVALPHLRTPAAERWALAGGGRAAAAGVRRRSERRLSLGGADPAVYGVDRRPGWRRHDPEAPAGAGASAVAARGGR